MVYITGAVFSRTEGYTSLANLIGPLIFHIVCMVLGGFCFVPSAQKVTPEISKAVTQ